VGLVRTALFNWAFARHTGGTFVFRIEDTDPERDTEQSYRQLVETMRWLGLDWDEGVEVGGPYAPYRQSERMDSYREAAARLLEAGHAYESFSTPEEVEARHLAAGRDPHAGYDGFDRDLTEAQRAAFRAEGRQPVLRVRMPDEDVTFTDLVRGEITFAAGSIPDFVIVRGNGFPLYTLVNPVDDAAMRITHVLRGEDLLSSTPRQVVLYRALIELGLAEVMPEFGHLPYVMGEGNRKLSKRDPESNVLAHRRNGFIPEGLLNYLALLGWSISPDTDLFTMDEMASAFELAHVNPNPARFDLAKARAINAAHVRMLPAGEFASRIVPHLHEAGLVSAPVREALTDRERAVLDTAAPLVQERTTLLGEVPAQLDYLFREVTTEDDAVATLRPEAPAILDASLEALATAGDFDAATLQDILRAALVEGLGLKPRFAYGPLRVALTGRRVSPPLFESMEILGREETLTRLTALRRQL
jgi:glutamyl-tRNA synthetase